MYGKNWNNFRKTIAKDNKNMYNTKCKKFTEYFNV